MTHASGACFGHSFISLGKLLLDRPVAEAKSPLGRSSSLVMQRAPGRPRNVAADFLNMKRFGRGVPAVLEFAGDIHTTDALEPGTDFELGAIAIFYFSEVRRALVIRFVRADIGMDVLQHRVETAVQFQKA